MGFDERGFVPLRGVMNRVQDRFPEVDKAQILEVIEGSEKSRFEFKDDMVRATYGHSFPVDLEDTREVPPEHLFYGTARDLATSILKVGLKPRDRQFVHLSVSAEEASEVGKRQDPFPAVVQVYSKTAHHQGIPFYHSGPLFLTKGIPPEFLALLPDQSA
ncbi:MAG: RNA 2'-phosphotransferase [Deltaproteobacteria bacterium]|nr:RNA 2'-phosphotransferase [Deltaproteobacteria bacterium]